MPDPTVDAAPEPTSKAEPGAEAVAVEHMALPVSVGLPSEVRGMRLEPWRNSCAKRAAAVATVSVGISPAPSDINCDNRRTGKVPPSCSGSRSGVGIPCMSCTAGDVVSHASLGARMFFGVGKMLSVGVAMAKGSSKSAQNFKELALACRDICLLVGLERTFRSSKKRSTEGDRAGLKSINVFRTIDSDSVGTPATSLQDDGASTSLEALDPAGASKPRAATGAPPPNDPKVQAVSPFATGGWNMPAPFPSPAPVQDDWTPESPTGG